MKVCLINPPQPELWNPLAYPPLGLLYVAAPAKAMGHDVEILNLCENSISDIPGIEFPYADVYGITCTTPLFPAVKALTQALSRKFPESYIVLGGIHPTLFPNECLSDTDAHIIITGEGETAFAILLEAINYGDSIEKIINAERIYNLDSLRFPARELMPDEIIQDTSGMHLIGFYKRNNYSTTIMTTRGCPYSCAFCCKTPHTAGGRYRSPKNIVQEFKWLVERYNIHQFRIIDDMFTLDRPRLADIEREVRKENLEIYLNTILRADSVDEETARIMYDIGVRQASIGVESGSPEILKRINKRETIEEIENCIALCKKNNIKIRAFLIFGLPGETLETIEQTKAFMRRNQPDSYTLSSFVPLPGSDIANNPEKYGISIEKQGFGGYWFYHEPGDDSGFFLNYPNREELIEARSELISYLRSGAWKE